ncbi:uncharacterized protein LOC135526929 isoform X3 [Oncorhynchus masou masou]|uniref:uncharacterized protein LOC135526929 isoform X3 n=1 Tax=Oncorhynchus masou masou TaxID=90313 RepID=UPI003183543D
MIPSNRQSTVSCQLCLRVPLHLSLWLTGLFGPVFTLELQGKSCSAGEGEECGSRPRVQGTPEPNTIPASWVGEMQEETSGVRMVLSPVDMEQGNIGKENRYRITHHNRTKRRCDRQRQQEQCEEYWTWEDELDGKGPWAQPGEYRRPKVELEATKAERRWYEEAARRRGWKPESQPQKCIGGGSLEVWRSQVGDLRQLPVVTGGLERPGRHHVTRCPQCGYIARCGTYQLRVSAGLEWASSQVP